MTKKNVMPDTKRIIIRNRIEKRRQELMDQVRAVAQGYTTALFVYGPGGLGKTHHITNELDALCGASWQHHTAYSTPKALFLSLLEAKDQIHVFEDCERLYKMDVASSILRAACGSPRGGARRITYETAGESLTCTFTGGIIIVSNESIERHASGALKAVASRFRPVKWDMTTEERMAAIVDLAHQDADPHHLGLTRSQRLEVARWLTEQMADNPRMKVDLRTYVEHALPVYAQWRNGDSSSHWKEILSLKLSGESTAQETRLEVERRWEDMAHMIWMRDELRDGPAKLKFWTDSTGMAQAQYYRYLKAAKAKRQVVTAPK